jgi:uncharacterized OB-fold protein
MNDRALPAGEPAAEAALHGGRCSQCGLFSIPKPVCCPACMSQEVTTDALAGDGTIYSATIVRSGPRNRKLPYGLAYVDLDAEIRVMAAYAVDEAQPLEPGQRVLVSQVGESEAGLPLLSVGAHPSAAAS